MVTDEGLSRARVLVIDDEEPLRRLIAMLVTSLGHAAYAAANTEEALAVLDRDDFDVIIVDLRMPGGLGTDLWRKVQHHTARAPVAVLMTADYEGPAIARRAGMLLLAKPFGAEELGSAIEQALAVRAQDA